MGKIEYRGVTTFKALMHKRKDELAAEVLNLLAFCEAKEGQRGRYELVLRDLTVAAREAFSDSDVAWLWQIGGFDEAALARLVKARDEAVLVLGYEQREVDRG